MVSTSAMAQTLAINKCDASFLTEKELAKCKIDSVWSGDILFKVNYISALKTELLPKYRLRRKSLRVTAELDSLLVGLKTHYDSVFQARRAGLELSMDKNQLFVQPKAYISSLLSFQLFAFYPDVYAVMLNPIHLQMRPVTSQQNLHKFQEEVNNVARSIPAALFKQIETIASEMKKEKFLLSQGYVVEIFRGMPEDQESIQNDVVNFLLWSK